jgi:hypothetical protein
MRPVVIGLCRTPGCGCREYVEVEDNEEREAA